MPEDFDLSELDPEQLDEFRRGLRRSLTEQGQRGLAPASASTDLFHPLEPARVSPDMSGWQSIQSQLTRAHQSSPEFETDQPNVEEALRRYAKSLGHSGGRGVTNAEHAEMLHGYTPEGMAQLKAQDEIEMALKKVAVRRVMEEASALEKAGRGAGEAPNYIPPGSAPEFLRSSREGIKHTLANAARGKSQDILGYETIGDLALTLEGYAARANEAKAAMGAESALSKLLPWAGKAAKVVGPIGAGLTAYSLGTGTARAAERQAAGEQGTGRTVGDILDTLIGPIPKDAEGGYDPLQNWKLMWQQMNERQAPPMSKR